MSLFLSPLSLPCQAKIRRRTIHLNLRPIKRYTRGIGEFLAFGLTARAFRAICIVFIFIICLFCRNIADNRVLRHA